ncbi:Mechanosensitive ion channel protein 10 [Smittium mucronatum]|uniref:Mechanosensitive ion channel protein 10 n=1 Tax=Smittium mucronatum TaxID=133383 RepID=A0A1R0GRI5_9FUNG|nr:Mechanosensitive ion channel protein 10 [Smittium mucronatum]
MGEGNDFDSAQGKGSSGYGEGVFNEKSRFTWIQKSPKSTRGRRLRSSLLRRIRNIIFILLIIALLPTPSIIYRFAFPSSPLFPPIDSNIDGNKETAFFQNLSHVGILCSMLFLIYFFVFYLFDLILKFVIYLVKEDGSQDVLSTLEDVELFRSLKPNIISFILTGIACIAWVAVFFTESFNAFNSTQNSDLTFNQFTFKLWVLSFLASCLFLAESLIMVKLAGSFHKDVYSDRIQRQKDIGEAINHFDSPKRLVKNNYVVTRDSRLSPKLLNKLSFSPNSKKDETEITVKGIYHSNYVFYRMLGDSPRKNLVPDDFLPFYDDREEAIDAFKLFDIDNIGSISLPVFQQTFIEYYVERGSIKSLFGICQAFWEKSKSFYNPLKNVVSFSGLTIAWSFVFGNSLKTSFDCFVFLFMLHPYDAGDHVLIDSRNMVVKKIRLLSTIFATTDGQNLTIPNSVVATKSIFNFRRSENQSQTYIIAVGLDTHPDTIQELFNRMSQFLLDNPTDYKPGLIKSFDSIVTCSTLNLKIGFTYRSNWQAISVWLRTKSNFIDRLSRELVALKITCLSQINVVKLTGSDERNQPALNF